MRWEDLPRSDNIEDRRGEGGEGPGGGFGLPVRTGGLGIGTIVVLGLIGWALGIDPRLLIGGAEILSGQGPGQSYQQTYPQDRGRVGAPSDRTGQFVSAVLGSADVQWKAMFAKAGKSYQAPRLVIFDGATFSSCGPARRAMGPFYCPNDQKVYLDTSFFRDLQARFHGCDRGSRTCEFAQAYVITHEVGHHVQYLLGILGSAQRQKRGMDRAQANELQVKIELQADCFAGVWANRAEQRWKLLEPGDIEAALNTASAIGDDRLQRQQQGYVVPDAFTHGTSEQRVRWFRAGFKDGRVADCNTLAAARL